jgi:hypothetical protein
MDISDDLFEIISNVITKAQKGKYRKGSKRAIKNLLNEIYTLKAKFPQHNIDANQVIAHYEAVCSRIYSLPAGMAKRQRDLVAARGNVKLGTFSAAEYEAYLKARLAMSLQVGQSSADYQRHTASQRAIRLGIGDSQKDYTRDRKRKRAIALGIGTSAADYNRHMRTAKTLKSK